MEKSLIELILPEGLLEHFEVVKVETGSAIKVYLDERYVKPTEISASDLESKGFIEPVCLQDFPIRDKACYLYLRRRKWLNKSSGEIISKRLDLAGTGTRMTSELADFLKESPGYYIG